VVGVWKGLSITCNTRIHSTVNQLEYLAQQHCWQLQSSVAGPVTDICSDQLARMHPDHNWPEVAAQVLVGGCEANRGLCCSKLDRQPPLKEDPRGEVIPKNASR
jgi:hypothetical protein